MLGQLRCSTTEPAVTAISAASVPRRSKAPRREVGICPQDRQQSTILTEEDTDMGRKRHTAEEIVAKLRQVDLLMAQDRPVADAVGG